MHYIVDYLFVTFRFDYFFKHIDNTSLELQYVAKMNLITLLKCTLYSKTSLKLCEALHELYLRMKKT